MLPRHATKSTSALKALRHPNRCPDNLSAHFACTSVEQRNVLHDIYDESPIRSLIIPTIERMPETTLDEIADKYVEMNVVHPFMEGNGRSTRIWLDLMLRRSLKRCVDWSRIDKNEYLTAMRESVIDSTHIKALLKGALTDKINDREMFMKGIDYSYYYEEE